MGDHASGIRRLRAAFAVLAVICTLISLATFGTRFPSLPWAPVSLNKPVAADSNGTVTAIVDSDSRRVLILNKNQQLQGVIDCEQLNSPIETVTDVCVSNDGIYIAGAQYQRDSTIISRERVVAYNTYGTSERILYDSSVNYGMLSSIKSMDCTDDGVYVLQHQEDYLPNRDPAVYILHIDNDGNIDSDSVNTSIGSVPSVSVFDIGYSAVADKCMGITAQGALINSNGEVDVSGALAQHVFTSLDVADDGSAYLIDDMAQSVYYMDAKRPDTLQTLIKGSGYANLHVNSFILSLCNLKDNQVTIRNLANRGTVKLVSVMPTQAMSLLHATVLFSRVYLAVFIVAFLAIRARRMIASGSTKGYGPMFASLVAVGIVALAIGYTTYGSYTTMRATRENEINLFGDYLSLVADKFTPCMEDCNNRKDYASNTEWSEKTSESQMQLGIDVGGLCIVATENGVGTYATIYGVDSDGIYYLYETSMEHINGSYLNNTDFANNIKKAFSTTDNTREMLYGSGAHDTSLYRLVSIPSEDGSSVVGVIEVGCRMQSFEASIANNQVERILALLVIMLVVYLTYVELRECAHCFVFYGQLRHHHDVIAVLTRPFSFFVTLLASIDAVMTTLIARSLLQSSQMSGSSILLALPSVMLGIGLALGQAIYGLLGSRVVIRTLMTRGAVAMVGAALLAAAIVVNGNFWLYCFAKLLMAIPFGLLYTLSYSLPRRADTDDIRAMAAGGIKRTDTSAAALGNVLGGYAAQALGNAWVYVLVAVVGTILLVMAWRLLPETKHPLEHEVAGESRHMAIIKLLSSKTTLPIIFFLMFPAILAAGYNSFLFPLFSANLGVSTSSINNLFVFGQLVVFVCIPLIERLEDRYDKWVVATYAIVLLGLVFLLFSFNTTLIWAVVSIALVGVFCKASDGWKAMWPRSARSDGLTTGIATGVMFSVRSILLIVQPLVLGLLLTIDSNLTMVVLGFVCLLCSLAFYTTTKRTALDPQVQAND